MIFVDSIFLCPLIYKSTCINSGKFTLINNGKLRYWQVIEQVISSLIYRKDEDTNSI